MFIRVTQQPPWKLHPQLVACIPFQGMMFVWCLCKCKIQLLLSFFLLSDACDCSCGSHWKLSFEVACPGNSWFGWLDFSITRICFICREEWGFLHCRCKTFSFFALSFWGTECRPVCGWYFILGAENHFWSPRGKKWAEQAQSLRGCSHKVGLLTSPLETISALQSGGDYPPAPLIPWAFWAGDDPCLAMQRESTSHSEFLLDTSLFACIVGTEARNCAVLSCTLESKKTPVVCTLI